jgi:hypothetical protein
MEALIEVMPVELGRSTMDEPENAIKLVWRTSVRPGPAGRRIAHV